MTGSPAHASDDTPPETGKAVRDNQAHADIQKLINALCEVIVGKERQIRLAVACLLARGHLLIEDSPGVGKTTLSQAFAKLLALDYRRMQFTSDLLPADVLGNSIYEQKTGQFRFHPGPVFCQLALVDEINRATPKTQSALLEAMEEYQVSADGVTYPLPKPFFVIATQNPQQQIGTFPLPESQLDRFLMRVALGYPDRHSERHMLTGQDRREMLRELEPVFHGERLLELQKTVSRVHVSGTLLDYLQDLLEASRQMHPYGLSPRSGLSLLHAAQAWALMEDRDMVLPEDVQTVSPYVMGHRLGAVRDWEGQSGEALAEKILNSVPVVK
jgi:MoxR-like ATPase